jgi:hypothetical protein
MLNLQCNGGYQLAINYVFNTNFTITDHINQ